MKEVKHGGVSSAAMRLTGDGECSVGSAGGEGALTVVGVKMDSRSKELLTWALVKIARPGDRVIALHVLNLNTGTYTLTLFIFWSSGC